MSKDQERKTCRFCKNPATKHTDYMCTGCSQAYWAGRKGKLTPTTKGIAAEVLSHAKTQLAPAQTEVRAALADLEFRMGGTTAAENVLSAATRLYDAAKTYAYAQRVYARLEGPENEVPND